MTDPVATRTAEEFIAYQHARWETQRAQGKLIKMKDVGRQGWAFWARTAWTFQVQHDYRAKVLVIERIEFHHAEGTQAHAWDGGPGSVEYRLGYYTLGGYRSGRNRWLWGQYSPMIPRQDFEELLSKARADGTILAPKPTASNP